MWNVMGKGAILVNYNSIHYTRILNVHNLLYKTYQFMSYSIDNQNLDLQFTYFTNSFNRHDNQWYIHIAYRLSSSKIYGLINLTRKWKLKLIWLGSKTNVNLVMKTLSIDCKVILGVMWIYMIYCWYYVVMCKNVCY